MDANSGPRQVQSVLRNARLADSRQVGGNDREVRGQSRHQRLPHSGGFGIAMQQQDRGTMTSSEVLEGHAVHSGRTHRNRFARSSGPLLSYGRRSLQEHRNQEHMTTKTPVTHLGILL